MKIDIKLNEKVSRNIYDNSRTSTFLCSRFLNCLLLLFFFLLTNFNVHSQFKDAFKNILNESKVITVEAKVALKASLNKVLPSFKNLSKNKILTRGLKSNLKKFNSKLNRRLKNETNKEIKDKIKEKVEEKIQDEIQEYFDERALFKEIKTNRYYPLLYKLICEKIGQDTLEEKNVKKILMGNRYKTFKIDSNKLYNIYFTFSDNFAIKELNQLKTFYNCKPYVIKEVNLIAEQREIELGYSPCKVEKSGVLEITVGSIIICLLIYLFYKLIKTVITGKP